MLPRITSAIGLFSRGVALFTSLYVLYGVTTPQEPMQERAVFLLLALMLVFVSSAAKRKSGAGLALDLVATLVAIVVMGYVIVTYDDIQGRIGIVYQIDVIFGVLATLVVLLATWQTVGKAVGILAMIFVLYAIFGYLLPLEAGGHNGYDESRIVTFIYLGMQGLFGSVVYVMFKYVYLFVMFGKVLEHTGAMSFIMDLSKALVGRFTGGPALVSVISSGMMGSVSGSAVANVMVTGSVTIPLMKRLGFQPHVAGAVEAAASTGGQFMPPVMGATAFLVAEFLNVNYSEVAKAAAVPAFLYYAGVLAAVYFYATAMGLRGLPRADLPPLLKVLLRPDGIVFVAGVGALIVALSMQISPMRAALYAMIACIAASFITWRPVGPRKVITILESTAFDFTSMGAAAAGIGIIIAMVLMTGLATRFTALILGFAGGNLLIVLILTMLVAIIMGCGLPTSMVYIILVLTAAPSLLKMGVNPMAAHLFVFYGGMLSMVTPPVAMAAYAGATLAHANFWKTGVVAARLSLPAYIVPFAFVGNSALLLMGPPMETVFAALTGTLGVISIAYGTTGAMRGYYPPIRRTACLVAGALMIVPGVQTDLFGIAVAIVALSPELRGLPRFFRRRALAPAPNVSPDNLQG